jgi:hypothetical protein
VLLISMHTGHCAYFLLATISHATALYHAMWLDPVTLPESQHMSIRSTPCAPTFVSDRISSISSLDKKKKRGKYSLKHRQNEVQQMEYCPRPISPERARCATQTASRGKAAEQRACASQLNIS